MDMFTLAGACLRRWFVLIPLVGISLVLGFVLVKPEAPTYTQNASFLIYAPPIRQSLNSVTLSNPLGGLVTAQAALVSRLNSPQVAQSVSSAGGAFSAVAEKTGGITDITAVSSSRSGATATLQAALRESATQLKKLQQQVNASASTFLKVQVLTTDTDATAAYPSIAKGRALVIAGGVLVSLVIVQVVDAIVLSMRRRRTRRPRPHPGIVGRDSQLGLPEPDGGLSSLSLSDRSVD